MAKVSVVIPVYNVENYLKECLDSVLNQTMQDIEVICVDDGSTDTSGKIIDEYVIKDSRVRVIHKANEGYGKAVNVGMDMATSPYIGIVESDDRVIAHMYEELYRIAEESNADVIKADHYEFYESNEGRCIVECVPLTRNESEFSLYNKSFNIREHEEAMKFSKYTWSGIYRTDFLRNENIRHNETPGASYQDNGFWFQTMVKADSLYFVPEAFYYYRIDNPNSSVKSTNKVYAVSNEYDFVNKILDEMGDDGIRFYRWSRYFRIWGNIGVISQLADEYKETLADIIKAEFLEGIRVGDIDMELYEEYLKIRIFDLLADTKRFVAKDKARREKIEGVTGDYSNIVLYGAGAIGKSVHGLLREGRVNTKISCFAVTQKENNVSEILGVPVKEITEVQDWNKDTLVIISVGKKYEQEVAENLKRLGFGNCIYYSELL